MSAGSTPEERESPAPAAGELRPPALQIEGLTKRFGDVLALDGVSFEVPERTTFGLLGPNGAGKTTLFSLVAGFLRPTAGAIRVLGIDAGRIQELFGRLSVLPQDALFEPNVPVFEQLVFLARLDGRTRMEAKDAVERALEDVGLSGFAERRVATLSHGLLKRLGLAQAFLGEPEVILLDEPTSGLDPQNAEQIRNLVRKFARRATIVLSSHNLFEVEELCSHVAILDRGKVLYAGAMEDLSRSERRYELQLSRPLAEEEIAELNRLPCVVSLEVRGSNRYGIALAPQGERSGADAALAAVLRFLLEREAVPREVREGATLQAHFLRFVGGEVPELKPAAEGNG